jgi:opacity protein-like surface antigen
MMGARYVAVLLVLLASGTVEGQQREESEIERDARLARQSGGLVAGVWLLDIPDPAGAVSVSTSPYVEGYYRRGLDRHLAVESSVGVLRREETERRASTIGGETTNRRTSWIVPLMTGLRFYPTDPGARLEPYVGAGIGLALGIQEQSGDAGGLLGGSGGTSMETGFGFNGTAGVELALSRVFRLTGGAGYQWVRFGNDVGAAGTYRGLRATGGFVYRFQY